MESKPPETPVHTKRKKLTSRTRLALWLIFSPTILLALTCALFALINEGNFTSMPNLTPSNLFVFVLGLLGIITWLPGLIVGIVLLATQKPKAKD